MASINGIELKGIKEFKGHEFEYLIQGNIYYKGKKVGWYSQDSWGGCDHIDLDYSLPKELLIEINGILDNYESDTIFYGIDELYDKEYNIKWENGKKRLKGGEWLFGELIQLIDNEKKYKKYSKQWGTNLIALYYEDLFTMGVMGSKLPKEIFETQLKNDKKVKLYYLYSGLEDFIVNINKESEENNE